MKKGIARENSSNSHTDSDTREPSDDLTSDTTPLVRTHSLPQRSLYEMLAPKAVGSPILFGWWPRAHAWCYGELVERTTRCLPAVRPHLDWVALPQLPEVQELWQDWVSVHGLEITQAVWFPPLLGSIAGMNPAQATCSFVLDQVLNQNGSESSKPKQLLFYPMYVTEDIVADVARSGLHLIGDAEDHVLMPLSSAKAWMHPHIAEEVASHKSSNLRSALPSTVVARGPFGYVATSTSELRTAWTRLQRECPPDTPLVLKPANGSGGCGVILNAQEADLERFDFRTASCAILEEMVIGCKPAQSPTIYMIGDTPCGFLADQVLSEDGATNLGNKYPSNLRTDLLPLCVEAAQAINQVWGLKCNWGLDFVINSSGIPIIVDLNMGRPNGNLAVRMWASRSQQPLSIFTSSWFIPEDGPTIAELTDALRSAGLLWNGANGVMVYQHFRQSTCSYAVASTSGDAALKRITCDLQALMQERFGIIIASLPQ
eukprot:CAMPEP_0178437926 /NCGR_PEP_ID=MMETSP0689_2-20121128/35278_1 /TAXON_ID=160604 /ORGANISM="Amphidinium massartii, Strain CS-259" /LENGTH=486 /DNA_ID=CAMNT_0020060211 /DNA_START=58 /DNA_END=1518 /DNA_ORIENTATION=+